MKTYKTTRPVGIAGKHCERGQVVQVSDKDAAYLLAVGDIIQISADAPDRATAPQDKVERATAPAAKKAAKKNTKK